MLNPVNCVESIVVNFMCSGCCFGDKLLLCKFDVVVIKVLVYVIVIKNFIEKFTWKTGNGRSVPRGTRKVTPDRERGAERHPVCVNVLSGT